MDIIIIHFYNKDVIKEILLLDIIVDYNAEIIAGSIENSDKWRF